MSLSGSNLARGLLAATLATTALLKAWHFLWAGDWQMILPLLRQPIVMSALVLIELALAAALLTRQDRGAAWCVAMLTATGAMITTLSPIISAEVAACGCLGSVPLTIAEHTMLAGSTFALAAVVILTERHA